MNRCLSLVRLIYPVGSAIATLQVMSEMPPVRQGYGSNAHQTILSGVYKGAGGGVVSPPTLKPKQLRSFMSKWSVEFSKIALHVFPMQCHRDSTGTRDAQKSSRMSSFAAVGCRHQFLMLSVRPSPCLWLHRSFISLLEGSSHSTVVASQGLVPHMHSLNHIVVRIDVCYAVQRVLRL